ncbi:MAG: hypothetical protein A3J28_12680 [Acidobacteria bacterium RIFCSPLOWO2_12_FULL_60_22]|nr:MAG: hypothetical protein A3J28_12680 [Acidobacteria bacterium RIFCSPLOWO2_12_FULL_60_22]
MRYEQMLEEARKFYAQPARPVGTREPFPGPPSDALAQDGPPSDTLAPEEFLRRLTEAAFRHHARLRHPFAARLVQGQWKKSQIQEWVRQDYPRIVYAIRRHSLLAANASDYETLWGLLTRVKVEADSDPVGGTFFALPQLWTKFGIALGLSREEIVNSHSHPWLALWNEAMLAEVRFSAVLPTGEFLDASLDPVFYRLWGEALEKALQLPHDALDFFWAIASDRWGEETGQSILQRWAGSRESQAELWDKYQAERQDDREWHRLTILQTVLEAGAASRS